MSRRRANTKLPAPFLQRIVLRDDIMARKSGYPYDFPWLDSDAFELRFTTPVTILIGENGTGKSTLVEAIAALSGDLPPVGPSVITRVCG
ncbi:AAA family ATPase, partial [Aliiruegeria sabulilitoris]|uniref:AAA family ATPase n=1 Tax=Aliiruegeria sabulilitoris TaxID=1510458 RepID=UPI0012E35101